MQQILPFGAVPFNNVYLVEVTPELARQWLVYNRINRPARPDVVRQYVQQIESGIWKRTHQGAAFTREGVLLDGQHRLFAIIQTGKTVTMLVFINEPVENYEFIDCGRNRSNLDMLRLGQRDNALSGTHMDTIRSFLAGRFCKTRGRWTSAEINQAFTKYGRAICFAVDLFQDCKDKRINDPTVRALIARAQYYISDERLAEFVTHLIKGTGHGPTVALRESLLAWGDRREHTRREIYKRTQQTLLAFLEGKDVAFRYDTTSEAFPITDKEESRIAV